MTTSTWRRRFWIDGDRLLNAWSVALVLTCVPWSHLEHRWLAVAIAVFAVVAVTNHLEPVRCKRLTHVVKAAYTHVLAASLLTRVDGTWTSIVAAVAVVVSVCDLLPLTQPPQSRVANALEAVGGVTRAIVVVVAFALAGLPLLPVLLFAGCSVVYAKERRARIAANRREAYSGLHALEHVAVWVLLVTVNAPVLEVRVVVVGCVLAVVPIAVPLIVCGVAFNIATWRAVSQHMPAWVDPQMRPFLEEKARANALSLRLQHYVIKPFTPRIAVHHVRFDDIEQLVAMLPTDSRYDVVVGVMSGGAFIAPLVARHVGAARVVYARSRLWSQSAFTTNVRAVLRYYFGRGNRTAVTFLDAPVDLRGLRVLVVDDSVCTGATLASVREACVAAGAADITTAALFCDTAHPTDLFAVQGRTPLIWPWGWESD